MLLPPEIPRSSPTHGFFLLNQENYKKKVCISLKLITEKLHIEVKGVKKLCGKYIKTEKRF